MNRSITDESLVTQIHEDTGGLPVLVELLAGTNPKPGLPLPDISKDAVKRFLQWIPEEESRRVALLAAVPRQFNLDILSACLGSNSENQFSWLSTQSYIRTSTIRGWFYHEKVRELMLRYLHNTTPSDLEAAHRRLVNYYEKGQNQLGSDNRSAQRSEMWQRLEVEKVYHLLSEQPVGNIGRAVSAFLEPSSCIKGFGESIPLACQQVGREIVSQEVQEWGRTLFDFYRASESNEHETLLRLANLLAQRNDLDQNAQHALFARRAETYRLMKLYPEALVDFNRAISLVEGCWATVHRGITYKEMGEYEKAEDEFNRVLTVWMECGTAIECLGSTHRLMGKFPEALADFDRLISNYKESSNPFAQRGETYRLMGKFPEALADFDRAVELDAQNHWAYEQRGLVLKALELYDEAVNSLTEAEKITPSCTSCVAERIAIYQLLGKLPEALDDADRNIALYNDVLYKDNDAISRAFSTRAEIYRRMGKYPEALADLEQAVSLNAKSSTAIAWRGEIHRRLGSYDEAIRDFSLAIQLEPNDTFSHSRRAAAYQVIGDFVSANSDIAHVNQVPAQAVSDFYNKAIICSLSGQSIEAIGFLEEAIQINSIARYYAQNDDLFGPLKSIPKFQELMNTTQ